MVYVEKLIAGLEQPERPLTPWDEIIWLDDEREGKIEEGGEYEHVGYDHKASIIDLLVGLDMVSTGFTDDAIHHGICMAMANASAAGRFIGEVFAMARQYNNDHAVDAMNTADRAYIHIRKDFMSTCLPGQLWEAETIEFMEREQLHELRVKIGPRKFAVGAIVCGKMLIADKNGKRVKDIRTDAQKSADAFVDALMTVYDCRRIDDEIRLGLA